MSFHSHLLLERVAVLHALVFLALAPAVPGSARAEEPPPPADPQTTVAEKTVKDFDIGGFVDVYYAYVPNTPGDHQSFFPGVGTSAKKANELGLNLATLTVSKVPAPLGFD